MYSTALPRTCLGFTNVLFFFVGFIGCGICVWCVVNTQYFKDVNSSVTKTSVVTSVANFVNLNLWLTPVASILIPVAVFTMLTSCCGIFSAACRAKCAVKSYICLVSLSTFTFFWLLFNMGIYNIYTEKPSTIRYLQNTIFTNYGKDNDLITTLWDYVMVNFKCCGAKSYQDFSSSNWKKRNIDIQFPVECCSRYNKTALVYEKCPKGELSYQYSYKVGCIYMLKKYIENHKGRYIFYAILIGIAYSLIMFFAYCIIRGEPLINALTDKMPKLLTRKKETNQTRPEGAIHSESSLENMMFVQEPPRKVVKVVSAVNPFQTYKIAPHVYSGGDFQYGPYHRYHGPTN